MPITTTYLCRSTAEFSQLVVEHAKLSVAIDSTMDLNRHVQRMATYRLPRVFSIDINDSLGYGDQRLVLSSVNRHVVSA